MDIEALRGAASHVFTASNSVLAEALDSDDGVPEWLQLTPNKGKFEGRDGRRFNVKAPNRLAREFNKAGEHIQFDLDHGSEYGFNSAAVGWVTELASRNGGELWARVEWTPEGETLVRNRTFRGISPVFRVTSESVEAFIEDPQKNAMEVAEIVSVALTNRPNLRLKSLNTQGADIDTDVKQPTMDIAKLLQVLGMNAETPEAEVLAALEALKARPKAEVNTKTVDLDQYVPRADFDQLNSQMAVIQAERKEAADKEFNSRRDRALTEALKAGKISPASEEYHRESCATEEGLERFAKYVKAVKPVVQPNTEEANEADKEKGDTVQANDRAAAERVGLTVEEYVTARNKLKAAGEIE